MNERQLTADHFISTRGYWLIGLLGHCLILSCKYEQIECKKALHRRPAFERIIAQ